jgi:DNA-directed RNA polymerase specialized sigma24 family protein
VFCLCELDGRSNREIAESLGINERAVATALHKARKRLAISMARFSRGQ